MKKLALAFVCLSIVRLSAQEPQSLSVGVNVFLGGRYDDLRMCVASPAGTKGGPIADIQLALHYWVKDNTAIGIKIPVMRPLLFALAFDMLQLEPEFTIQYRKEINSDIDFIIEPSLGASFHYGPDYKTEISAKNPGNFFAAGPLLALLGGIGWRNDSNLRRFVGLKPFYVPFFSKERDPGTVLGAVLEGHWDFAARE